MIWQRLGMHTDTMADGKANVAAIEHCHGLLFALLVVEEHLLLGGALLKNGRAVGSLDHHLWLKQPGLVAVSLGLVLSIHQEEADGPARAVFAHDALDEDLRLFLAFRLPGLDRPLLEWDLVGYTATLRAPPDPFGCASRSGNYLAVCFLVMPPEHRHQQTARLQVHPETHAQR